MEELQRSWKELYAKELPALAKARDKSQKSWPVFLDHCFARIILDNAVGIDKPWTETIKSPAIKHMTEEQINDAIKLGKAIISGDQDINTLNQQSLDLRGKAGPSKRKAADDGSGSKRRKLSDSKDSKSTTNAKGCGNGNISTYFLPSPQSPGTIEGSSDGVAALQKAKEASDDTDTQLRRISESNLTPFRKQTLSMLCQIPRGQYSTYQAMSNFITKTSHKTCARAVGNAMRNNPFAPEVPCHRIIAADGSLGGFGGHWGEAGRFAKEKHRLLHDEGVRFDSKGKVKGPAFRDFKV